MAHDALAPATLLNEELGRLVAAARGRPLLDLACGRGRNALAAAEFGLRVVGVDRDRAVLAALGARASEHGLEIARVRADVETAHGLPFRSNAFGGVLVFRFLFRPLAREIVRVLAPGGVLVYETFTRDGLALGSGPENPAFLLERGELPALFPELRVVRSEEGMFCEPGPLALARLVAEKAP